VKIKEELSNTNEFLSQPDGIIVIDQERKIIAFNQAACRLTGYKENIILSKELSTIVNNPNDVQHILNSLNGATDYSNFSLEISHAQRGSFNVIASIIPINQPSQGIIGVIIIFRDTLEMIRVYNELQNKNLELQNEKNKMEAIFNSRTEGTFTIGLDWKITAFNRAAENITGFTVKESVGKDCREIFLSNELKDKNHLGITLSKKIPTFSNEIIIEKKSGKKVPVRTNSAPLFNAVGEQIGAVETFQDISEIKNLTSQLEERFQFENIIGRSKPMLKIFELMENVIQSDSNILITGESGTGKEVIARAIHINSKMKSQPFMAINCSAFAETLLESELFGHEKGAFTGALYTKPGRFELAGEGTLFIDEIGDLSPQIQVKLLRVLEARQFERVGGNQPIKLNARIITATNKNLEEEIKEERFREDLYYRINVINIHLPPLRERMDDFLSLVNYFLKRFNKKFNKNIRIISPSALRIMQNYNWPGNIRELENAIEHAFVVCNGIEIKQEHLPDRINKSPESYAQKYNSIKNLAEAEKLLIIKALEENGGNRQKAALSLGMERTTLWRKMKSYKLL
jgi:PAS domain S-box-containing protein